MSVAVEKAFPRSFCPEQKTCVFYSAGSEEQSSVRHPLDRELKPCIFVGSDEGHITEGARRKCINLSNVHYIDEPTRAVI